MQRRTSVEIQAYSVEEATRLALEELGLTTDDVDIEVLSDAGPDEDAEALVRVTAKGMASQPIPKSQQAVFSTTPAPPRDRGNERTDRGNRQRNRGNGGDDSWRGGRSGPDDRPSRRGTPPQRAAIDREATGDEAIAREIVSELLSRMDVTAEVHAVDNPSSVPLDDEEPATIFIDIVGRDLGNLIGRRGDHLSHIQYLVNMLVNRRLETYTRVIVDVEGYRSRREESLVGLAERVARQVVRTNRPIVLEPMPPNERRIIHLALRQNPEVTTQSSGEGNQRRITVEPSA
ncbi:MAG TPA: RNA-binding cell elongation regulator Jag/EloR [Thermomicrobiales bacterium]|nr:RNA-binding cell elongation regulator Jag/EloR [Thermomicrobiales bacterium]